MNKCWIWSMISKAQSDSGRAVWIYNLPYIIFSLVNFIRDRTKYTSCQRPSLFSEAFHASLVRSLWNSTYYIQCYIFPMWPQFILFPSSFITDTEEEMCIRGIITGFETKTNHGLKKTTFKGAHLIYHISVMDRTRTLHLFVWEIFLIFGNPTDFMLSKAVYVY